MADSSYESLINTADLGKAIKRRREELKMAQYAGRQADEAQHRRRRARDLLSARTDHRDHLGALAGGQGPRSGNGRGIV
jgi:hypothetical protein